MARASANFKEAIWDLARLAGWEPDDTISGGGLTSQQKQQVLLDWNRAYDRAYTYGPEWEDAWQSATLTPTAGVLTWTQLGDARTFTLWSEDPRPTTARARAVDFLTSTDGVHPQTTEATVYAFWLPSVPRFTLCEWSVGETYAAGAVRLASDGDCYVALRSTTNDDPTTSADDWRKVPVLTGLREATLDLGRGYQLGRDGQHGAARVYETAGLERLDNLAAAEFPRVATWWWTRRQP